MSSNAPNRGPNGTLQRILPLLVMGLSFLLLFQLFPQFFGGPQSAPAATPTDAAIATPVPAAEEEDTSTKTQIWNTYLVHPLQSGLRFLTNTVGLDAGTAIILFTVAVKLVLLPLTLQQIRSQKAMLKLQPELKALQAKLSKDKEKLGVETMALYKQRGVNPAAGCFPILLQMPVLFGLYAALNNLGTQHVRENDAFQQPWLWVTSLATPDILQLPFLGFPLPFILPILAAATQWVQQMMMAQPTEDPQQKMQQQIFQFMPLMMLWFGISFSAGLALYWVTQNVIGIVQQYFSTGLGSLTPLVARLRGRGGEAAPTVRNRAAGGGAGGARAPREARSDGRNGKNRGGDNSAGSGGAGEGRRTRGKR